MTSSKQIIYCILFATLRWDSGRPARADDARFIAGWPERRLLRGVQRRRRSDLLRQVPESFPRKLPRATDPHEPSVRTTVLCVQGRNGVRWRPGQETSLAPPVWTSGLSEANLLLNEVLVTLLGLYGAPAVILRPGIAPPLPPLLRPCVAAWGCMIAKAD